MVNGMVISEHELASYADVSYRVALSYCKNTYDAEDIVQNVLLKLVQGELHFEDDTHVRKWVVRVTVNECKSLWRSFWKKNISSLEEADEPMVFSSPEKSDLFYALQKLSPKYRIVIHLYYYEEYSIKEIAKLLHLKETTVQTQLMRARNFLKQQLKEAWQ